MCSSIDNFIMSFISTSTIFVIFFVKSNLRYLAKVDYMQFQKEECPTNQESV